MKRDIWSVVFFLVIAGFGLACTMDVRESMIKLPGDSLGATGFPRIFGYVLFGLCVLAAGLSFFRKLGEAGESQLTRESWGLIFVSCGYILGISYVGFAISTLIYLFLTSAIFVGFKKEKLGGIAIYSVVVTGVAFTFFKVFKVYLPETIFF